MHLLNTTTRKLKYFLNIPPYAILSHTWGEEEVAFDDIDQPHAADLKGYTKIVKSCAQASQDGFDWIWIDTCCIDKRSSAELSEAINLMYTWYWNAELCYAYLADLPQTAFGNSKWFTRGWTLQELLAPPVVEFYSSEWKLIGTKLGLVDDIELATGIGRKYLKDRKAIRSASIGKKFSWTSGRQTTRPEDVAYSLLGMMQISMPLLYGEGRRAFYRLQLEILRSSRDHTIFLWEFPDYMRHGAESLEQEEQDEEVYGILASYPDWFSSQGDTDAENRPCRAEMMLSTYEMTNMGIRIKLPCISTGQQDKVFGVLNCCTSDDQWLAVPLQRRPSGQYKRCNLQPVGKFSTDEVREAPVLEILAEAESLHIIPEPEGRLYRVMIQSVRMWDFPNELTGLDWVGMTWVKNFRKGSTSEILWNPNHRTHPHPVIPYSLRKRVLLSRGETGALRLFIGGMTIVVAFSFRQQQPCLGVFQPQQSADEEAVRLSEYREEIACIWEQYEAQDLEYNRDNLKFEKNGKTFVVIARKQLWKAMPCWSLTVEIWNSAEGKAGDQAASTRPYIQLIRDVNSETQNFEEMNILRHGYILPRTLETMPEEPEE